MAGLFLAAAGPLAAQGHRLRIDSRLQGVSWRGIERDSISRESAVATDGRGFTTPDGYLASCDDRWCHFLRAGGVVRAAPLVTQADLTLWGLGMTGLRARLNLRHASDLAGDADWPGTTPDLQLVEAHLEYQRGALIAHAGRQFLTSRLSAYGLDGARLAWQPPGGVVDGAVYAGWGLARGAVLPVTSPALNPLDDFQPRDRQVAVGAEVGIRHRHGDLRLEYRREIDPAVDYFVSERAATSLTLRPGSRWAVAAGAAYDLATAQWGSADLAASWLGPRATVTLGARRYLPFFDLWTIWGAFSPVAFHAVHGTIAVAPGHGIHLHLRGERYQFEESGAASGLVAVEDHGWRVEGGATWEARPDLSVALGHQAEFGPGASSLGYEGRITWRPAAPLTVTAHAATLRRPLEVRWSDASLDVFGGDVEWRPGATWRFGVGATRVSERRERPDPAAIDWNQWRFLARITLFTGTEADRQPLPRATRTGATP
jgi:hypothetical protein